MWNKQLRGVYFGMLNNEKQGGQCYVAKYNPKNLKHDLLNKLKSAVKFSHEVKFNNNNKKFLLYRKLLNSFLRDPLSSFCQSRKNVATTLFIDKL